MATKKTDGTDEIKVGSQDKKPGEKRSSSPDGQSSKTKNPTAAKDKQQQKKAADAKSKKGDDDDIEIGESLRDFRQFLKDVVIEFSKISWPPRQQVVKETWSVLFLVTVITLMVLGFDWFLGHAIFGPLEHWARLHGGGVGLGRG